MKPLACLWEFGWVSEFPAWLRSLVIPVLASAAVSLDNLHNHFIRLPPHEFHRPLHPTVSTASVVGYLSDERDR